MFGNLFADVVLAWQEIELLFAISYLCLSCVYLYVIKRVWDVKCFMSNIQGSKYIFIGVSARERKAGESVIACKTYDIYVISFLFVSLPDISFRCFLLFFHKI